MLPYENNQPDKFSGRNTSIDIIKGIGIIFMVWGHAAGPFKHWIYLFHMAIFFIASGMLCDGCHASSIPECKIFLIRKIKSLWLPFTLCNAFFNLIHNLFLKTGIYTNNPKFHDSQQYRTIQETLIAVLKNLFMAGGSQLGGATWFLRTLFQISVTYMAITYISNKFNIKKLLLSSSITICVICATAVSIYKIKLPLGIHCFFASFIAFLLGVFLHNMDFSHKILKQKYKVLVISFIFLCLLNKTGSINMSSGNITNIGFFVTASLSGWFMLYTIASYKHIKTCTLLVYIGQHTLCILLFHLLAFKIVTWIYILITNKDIQLLASFPVIRNIKFLWIPYTFCGIAVPLALGFLFLKILHNKHKYTTQKGGLYKYAAHK